MPKRLATLVATLAASITMLAALPLAAQAAESPWWQVLTSSRPGNLWVPQSQVQELQAGPAFTVLSIEGTAVACMYSEFCPAFFLMPNIETAQQLEEALEAPAAYGSGNVEVVEEPEASRRFLITSIGEDAGRAVPPLEILLGPGSSAEVVTPAASGRLVLTLTNLGDAPMDATGTPLTIVDQLPEGAEAVGVEAFAGATGKAGPVDCAIEAADLVRCSFEDVLTSYDAIEVEVLVGLTGKPPVAGAPGEVTVSGGNAASASAVQEIEVSPEPTPFGIDHFSAQAEEEGGGPATQAGGHPFQLTTTIQLNVGRMSIGNKPDQRDAVVEQPAMPRNLRFPLPAGLVGNASAMPRCDMQDFFDILGDVTNHCPDASAIGAVAVTIIEGANLGYLRPAVPLFNLPPAEGEPARFGFVAAGVPVVIDTKVVPGDRYRIVAEVRNITQAATFLSSTLVLWGAPGDPRHDSARGWNCVHTVGKSGPCERPASLSEEAFLRQPVSCDGPLDFDMEAEPWNVPIGSVLERASFGATGLKNCHKVPFDPTIAASPSSKLAANPSGLEFRLDMPNFGLVNKDAIAEAQPKRVQVTLPEGVTINASQAEGLAVCSPADYAREEFGSRPGEGCPNASKIGEVQVSTPLLKEEPRGALYVAEPKNNPFGSLIALYLVARVPERGILIKQAGVVRPHPKTGQLVTTFDDIPQLPFSSFKLRFREGGRAPLVTPPGCGTFETVAKFTPWSATDPDNPLPSEIVTRTSSFQIERGVDGGACPGGGVPPFGPGFEAGSVNPAAGRYSPFYMRLTRRDGEQDLTKFSATLPEGALAKLAGVSQCPQAAVEAAKGRDGLDEKESPSCPASSRIGRTTVGAGVGSILTWVPGQLYLGGPYKGAPLSVVSITPAVAGPFDVGTVVVQEGLSLDPRTGAARVDGSASDPIPHILAGIPLKVRDVRVYVDRPEFTITPTSCDPMATGAEIFGSGVDVFSVADDPPVALSARYQAADCSRLGFKPRLKIHLASKRSTRGAFPRVRGLYRPRAGDANSDRISVVLPGSELLENAHFRTICTRVQFAANGGLGSGCPKGAIYGKVKAWTPLLDEPLSGPVYLRSSNHELPDMVAVLKGLVDIESAARIDSVGGRIRVTFEDIPDAPLTKVLLNMQGGKKGLLVNATDVCKGVHRARARLVGHNGKLHVATPKVTAKCKGKRRR